MLAKRLHQRCPSAIICGIARAEGFALSFNKRSKDGSGKATLSNDRASSVYGVVFEIKSHELAALDRSEGKGYHRVDKFPVLMEPDRLRAIVTTYIGDPLALNTHLQPYDWYLRLMIEGAQEN